MQPIRRRHVLSRLVDFRPLPDSPLGELEARFDIILGINAS